VSAEEPARARSDGVFPVINSDLKVFAGTANPKLAERICANLGIEPGRITINRFPDAEIYCKIDEDVRGRDIFIIQPTCPPVNEHLMELLVMLDCFRRASADRITAVIPYYGYARQDRKDEGRVPISAKLVANLIVEAGANRVLCMDLHAAQIQGFFDVPVDHLIALPVLHQHFESRRFNPDELVTVSPDVGRIKLASKFQQRLGGGLAIIDKRRTSATETIHENIIGSSVDGKVVIVCDDMISTGGSILGATQLLHKHGAREIHVVASHGLFCGTAVEKLGPAPIKSIVVTDSVPRPADVEAKLRVTTLSSAWIFAEAIRRIHHNESVSYLFSNRFA
jgi:ribose-phosphate pyrophosphokinase